MALIIGAVLMDENIWRTQIRARNPAMEKVTHGILLTVAFSGPKGMYMAIHQ